MDRAQLYKIYRRVVDCENFSRAADQLQIPRSTVSTAISELEMLLGVRLIQRTTRRIFVTEQGQEVYQLCGEVLTKIDELESQFQQQALAAKGTVRVNVPSRIGRLIIAPALPHFIEQNPEISIELGMSDGEIDLIQSGVDCVLRAGTLSDSRLVQRQIGVVHFINVASPAYLQNHGTPQTPQELDAHRIVAYASPTSGRIEPFEWHDGQHKFTQEMSHHLAVNSAEGLIAGALAGLGIIQIPRYDVLNHIKSGHLKEIMSGYINEPMALSIVYPHRAHMPRRLRIFIQWLESCVRQNILTQQSVNTEKPHQAST